MQTSDETTNVIKALIKVQAVLKPISKDRENPFAGSKYATLDAILEKLLPILASNELAITQNPVMQQTEKGMRIGVETKLLHSSGEFFLYEPFFMELEKGSKMNMAQSAGSIITYAKRYAISAIFGISTDEDNDGVQKPDDKQKQNNNQQQRQNYNNKPPMQPQNQPSPKQQEEELTGMIVDYVNKLKSKGVDVSQLYTYIANKEGVQNVSDVPKVKILGYMKAQYLKIKNNEIKDQQQQNQQQGSLLEGRTTKPSNEFTWGNK